MGGIGSIIRTKTVGFNPVSWNREYLVLPVYCHLVVLCSDGVEIPCLPALPLWVRDHLKARLCLQRRYQKPSSRRRHCKGWKQLFVLSHRPTRRLGTCFAVISSPWHMKEVEIIYHHLLLGSVGRFLRYMPYCSARRKGAVHSSLPVCPSAASVASTCCVPTSNPPPSPPGRLDPDHHRLSSAHEFIRISTPPKKNTPTMYKPIIIQENTENMTKEKNDACSLPLTPPTPSRPSQT